MFKTIIAIYVLVAVIQVLLFAKTVKSQKAGTDSKVICSAVLSMLIPGVAMSFLPVL